MADIKLPLRPFLVPNFVHLDRQPASGTLGGGPQFTLGELDDSTLDRMCEDFRQAVLTALSFAIYWLDRNRDRAHASDCRSREPSAQCSCGLHRVLSGLRQAHVDITESEQQWHAGWLVSNSEGDEEFVNNPSALAERHYKGGSPLALSASFMQAAPKFDGCAECGKTSTPDAMWALYCVECIEHKIAPAMTTPTRTEFEAAAYRWMTKHYAVELLKHFPAPRPYCDSTEVVHDAIATAMGWPTEPPALTPKEPT